MKRLNKVPLIENDSFFLRGITDSDAGSIIEFSRYDSFIAKTEEDVLKILHWINQDFIKGESIHWGILLKSTNEIIGNIGYHHGFSEDKGEIGYVLKEAYRGKGIMSEVLSLVVEFSFNELKLSGIKAYTGYTNKASIGVLEKNGFKGSDNNGEGLVFTKKS